MNRSAYLTTGFAIKALANLSKAKIALHGQENIPAGPTIFVINHFTRIETILLPTIIFNLTGVPVQSLAHSSLFQGGLAKFFDLVGVLSTANPKRDETIIASLLTGASNWIIFPEGSMVKTKQITHGGSYMVTDPKGMRKPHTGAATLALRTELYRHHLLHSQDQRGGRTEEILTHLQLNSLTDIIPGSTTIVPVNLTYYPLRARENIVSALATKMVKDIPARMVEEIMLEGTMLLSGVDIDIHFGQPIAIAPYLHRPEVLQQVANQDFTGFTMTDGLKGVLHDLAGEIMQRYMHHIYAMTTVNHDHLFAAFLRLYPFRSIRATDLQRRVFWAATLLGERQYGDISLHQSLHSSQSHLLTDDRFGKFSNFLQLALDTKILQAKGDLLTKDRSRLSTALSFHRGRIDNPIEVIANEVEPLPALKKLLLSLAWRPDLLLRLSLIFYLLKRERQRHRLDQASFANGQSLAKTSSFLLPSYRRRVGVVLVHSYLASPAEVRPLARYLQKRGYWVYAPRLPGHGTAPGDLASRCYQDWLDAVENGYALIKTICDRVVLGGLSAGASLAFDLAARSNSVAGVFAIDPPLHLQDYSTDFMPSIDVWDRLVKKLRGGDSQQFFQFITTNPHITYRQNPYTGIREVGRLLERVTERLADLTAPTLVIQTDNDPSINRQSAAKVFDHLGSPEKQLRQIDLLHHRLPGSDASHHLHLAVSRFIDDLWRT